MRMPLTPKRLSCLATSAPLAGSSGGLVIPKGYPPNPATSPGTPASPEAVASPLLALFAQCDSGRLGSQERRSSRDCGSAPPALSTARRGEADSHPPRSCQLSLRPPVGASAHSLRRTTTCRGSP